MEVIKDMKGMWCHLWYTDQLRFWLGAIGTIASIIASATLNFTILEPNMWVILTFYTIGSVCLGITSYMIKDSWMILLMSWYTLINTVGVYELITNG